MEINFEEYEINMKIIRIEKMQSTQRDGNIHSGKLGNIAFVRQYPTFYTKTHERVYISGE